MKVRRFVLISDAEWYEKYLASDPEIIRWTKKLNSDGRGYFYTLFCL